jgi:hypothetical protein
MKSLRILAVAFAATCLMTAAAVAADPTGNWKWTQQGRGGSQEITAKLALKDGALTGSITSPGRGGGDPVTTDISDASFKDGMIAFSLVREFNGNKIVTKYSGKLDGDTITGSSERPGRGDGAPPMKTDWVATRVAAMKM